MFGIDVVPFLATSFDQARKLWAASKSAIENRFVLQQLMVIRAEQGFGQALPDPR